MAETCAMGLGQQLARSIGLETNIRREDDRHAPVTEGRQHQRRRSARILIQLQPAILWNRHRPIARLTAQPR